MTEQDLKEARVQELMAEKGLDALVLRRASSFSWATCGKSSYINTATDYGDATLVYTSSGRYAVANNIETPRLEIEEGLGAQGWEFVTPNWYEPDDALERLTQGMRVGADGPLTGVTDVSSDMARLRSRLTTEEVERFRQLARLCADGLNAAMRRIEPGQTEHEIAGLLAGEMASRGVWPVVDLVATDERIYKYRHPLPTEKRLERYAMVVLCGRKWGLVCSATRLAHFGALPDELKRKQEAVAQVDASFITSTRPDATVAGIFNKAVQTYADAGFPDEWWLHHQGGAAGYEPREYVGTPSSSETVQGGQVFTWNPSITGVKSEDTILVDAEGNEILTEMPEWPSIGVELDGQAVSRPAILEIG